MNYYIKVISIVCGGIAILGGLVFFFRNPAPKPGETVPVSVSPQSKTGFYISSSAFEDGGMIPIENTCDGNNTSPPLSFGTPPLLTKTLALLVDDIDTPKQTWVHWIVWNIPPDTNTLNENSTPGVAVVGINGFGKHSYGGPCPQSGRHRYVFRLYALDVFLNLPSSAGKDDLIRAMNTHILAHTEFTGVYSR